MSFPWPRSPQPPWPPFVNPVGWSPRTSKCTEAPPSTQRHNQRARLLVRIGSWVNGTLFFTGAIVRMLIRSISQQISSNLLAPSGNLEPATERRARRQAPISEVSQVRRYRASCLPLLGFQCRVVGVFLCGPGNKVPRGGSRKEKGPALFFAGPARLKLAQAWCLTTPPTPAQSPFCGAPELAVLRHGQGRGVRRPELCGKLNVALQLPARVHLDHQAPRAAGGEFPPAHLDAPHPSRCTDRKPAARVSGNISAVFISTLPVSTVPVSAANAFAASASAASASAANTFAATASAASASAASASAASASAASASAASASAATAPLFPKPPGKQNFRSLGPVGRRGGGLAYFMCDGGGEEAAGTWPAGAIHRGVALSPGCIRTTHTRLVHCEARTSVSYGVISVRIRFWQATARGTHPPSRRCGLQARREAPQQPRQVPRPRPEFALLATPRKNF